MLENQDSASMREEYTARINRVIDYIEKNLRSDLSLNSLSKVACFSPFHFHRIFKAAMGETLNHFINRLRLQRAAASLVNNPKKSITEIALDSGFSSSSTFARAFKQYFGISASQWRSGPPDLNSKKCKSKSKNSNTNGNNREELIQSSLYVDDITRNLNWRIEMDENKLLNIEVKEMPEFTVAYLRHVGPYAGDGDLFEGLFNRLFKWAGPRGLFESPCRIMAVYHDDPKITEEDKLRVSACITVSQDMSVDGEIGKMTVPGGKFAVAGFELEGSHEYEPAWDLVFGKWLPESGFQPDDRLCYEIYHNNPKEHPEGHHIVDICIPVKPM